MQDKKKRATAEEKPPKDKGGLKKEFNENLNKIEKKRSKSATQKAKRRRTGRTETRKLFTMSENAYRLGKSATRIYGTIRIQATPSTAVKLRKIAEFYKISISNAARRMLYAAEAIREGDQASGRLAMRYFQRREKTAEGSKRRHTLTKADKTAAQRFKEGDRRRGPIVLRLTARNLADIEAERAENAANLSKDKTFSRAFHSLIFAPLVALSAEISNAEKGAERSRTIEARKEKPNDGRQGEAKAEKAERIEAEQGKRSYL